MAFDPRSLDELARKLADAVPPGPDRAQERPRAELQGRAAGRAREARPGDAPGVRHPGRRAAPQPRAARGTRAAHRRDREGPEEVDRRGREPVTLATVLTRAQFGLDAPLVRVEVHCGAGLPQFSVVGLAETAVRESRERVRAALAHCGFEFPAGRVTVNLAPADLPKEGGRFDLAVALGILAASEQLPAQALEGTEFYGELSLSGELRPVRGALAAAVHAVREGRRLVVPAANADEARVAAGRARGRRRHADDGLQRPAGGAGLEFSTGGALPACGAAAPDLADVRGQAAARRALEIAAAGGHSLLLIGPPGAGKSMLAQRLPGLLPPLDDAEALECAMLHSLDALCRHSRMAAAPVSRAAPWRFRRGRHRRRRSPAAGRDLARAPRRAVPRRTAGIPARRARGAARAARIRDGQRRARRLARAVSRALPARRGDESLPLRLRGRRRGRCRCTQPVLRRYVARISGPLLDRIDLHVEVPRLEYAALTPGGRGLGAERGRGRASARRAGAPGGARHVERAAPGEAGRRRLGNRPARARAPRCGIAAARSLRPRLPPDPARRSHRRGPRRAGAGGDCGTLGSDRLPAARSRAAGSGRLAALRHHVSDSRLDRVVGKIHATALGRHEARGTLVARDGMLFERRRALRDARGPGRLVTELRRTRDAGAMADHASRFVDRLPWVGAGAVVAPPAAGAAFADAAAANASAALSCPATATWPNGLMRACASACINGSSLSRAPFGPLSTIRDTPINASAIAIRMPSTTLKTFMKCRSGLAILGCSWRLVWRPEL